MTGEYHIGEARPEEAPAAAALLAELAAAESETSDVTIDDVRRFIAADDRVLLVARGGQDGDLVGLVAYAVFPSFFRAVRWAHIGFLVVAAEQRGRGTGRALLEAAVADCAARGLHEVGISTLPHNEAARHLYRSCGFVERTIGLERRLANAEDGR